MELLERRILSEGEVLPGNVVKVGSFLNHQIDVSLLLEMGREVNRLFSDAGVTKILTVEASGIAIATAFAAVMGVPVLFAKKHGTSNLSGDMLSARTHSYTHNTDYNMVVEKKYLTRDDCVLLVDDFLANGQALNSLIDIVSQSGARLAGCAIAVEKGFQHGGDRLREQGIRVESLAIIDSIDGGTIRFRRW